MFHFSALTIMIGLNACGALLPMIIMASIVSDSLGFCCSSAMSASFTCRSDMVMFVFGRSLVDFLCLPCLLSDGSLCEDRR